MKLSIKAVKPFTELTLNVAGISKPIVVGVKSYPFDELLQVRDRMTSILESSKLEQINAILEKLSTEGDKTSEEFYSERAELLEQQKAIQENQEEALLTFYKDQIVFLRNIEVTIEDKDLSIKDTRDVTPIESLWENGEDCLAVLLNTFLNYVPFRDSLFTKLTQAIFNPTESGKTKN